MPKQKILLVEDDGIIAFRFEQLLESRGYQTVSVASGEEAVALAQKNKPDLVLMDVRLAGEMDGTQAAVQIREKMDIPIVFMTAFSDDTIVTQAKDSAPYGYLVKPVQEKELFVTIETALYRHSLDSKIKENESRLRILFENSPYPILEADFSGLHPAFDRLKAEGVTELCAHFVEHPESLAACCAAIKTLDFNKEMMAFHQTARREEVPPFCSSNLDAESAPVFAARLVAFMDAGAAFECEVNLRNRQHQMRTLCLRCVAIPGHEKTLRRVLISFVDITERKHAEREREKLILELKQALAKVRTLSGLLPICAGCKKIRDDKGYWTNVESYVQMHSNAQFSHGLCPECLNKYYPEYSDLLPGKG